MPSAPCCRARAVLGRVGVGPDAETAELIGPLEQLVELGRDLGRNELDLSLIHAAGSPVDGDHVAATDLPLPAEAMPAPVST